MARGSSNRSSPLRKTPTLTFILRDAERVHSQRFGIRLVQKILTGPRAAQCFPCSRQRIHGGCHVTVRHELPQPLDLEFDVCAGREGGGLLTT